MLSDKTEITPKSHRLKDGYEMVINEPVVFKEKQYFTGFGVSEGGYAYLPTRLIMAFDKEEAEAKLKKYYEDKKVSFSKILILESIL